MQHTLPPLTARVQGPPIVAPGVREAALQYTFVGAPGDPPLSLRAFTLTHSGADTASLIDERLFGTFGPTWWMQRKPYTFIMASEYDRLLPVHFILEPHGPRVDARSFTGKVEQLEAMQLDEIVCARDATVMETRPRRGTVTLSWPQTPGEAQIRIRVQDVYGDTFREGQVLREFYGRLVARRVDVMEREVRQVLPDLPLAEKTIHLEGKTLSNPLSHYEALLSTRVQGTCSVIHGDLNLENVLVGPGDLVWLIDFAATREGHTLFDFARLEAELTTQVVAERFVEVGLGIGDFLKVLERLDGGEVPASGVLGEAQIVLNAVRRIAGRCLFDPADAAELRYALILAYLGTLKFVNLDQLPSAPMPKVFAFTAAAYLLSQLIDSGPPSPGMS
ncbi:MAG: phosphotransferase [Anaerolineales bacterium]|nr:phosphotransferase [Anaerolineales bacterium]